MAEVRGVGLLKELLWILWLCWSASAGLTLGEGSAWLLFPIDFASNLRLVSGLRSQSSIGFWTRELQLIFLSLKAVSFPEGRGLRNLFLGCFVRSARGRSSLSGTKTSLTVAICLATCVMPLGLIAAWAAWEYLS